MFSRHNEQIYPGNPENLLEFCVSSAADKLLCWSSRTGTATKSRAEHHAPHGRGPVHTSLLTNGHLLLIPSPRVSFSVKAFTAGFLLLLVVMVESVVTFLLDAAHSLLQWSSLHDTDALALCDEQPLHLNFHQNHSNKRRKNQHWQAAHVSPFSSSPSPLCDKIALTDLGWPYVGFVLLLAARPHRKRDLKKQVIICLKLIWRGKEFPNKKSNHISDFWFWFGHDSKEIKRVRS